MKVLLSGYYGFDNAGDDAVLLAIVQALREMMPDVEITVLSNQPQKTAAWLQVQAVDRWGKSGLLKAVSRCDVLLSGGGSLLQDVTSRNSILYYLGIIQLAQWMHKKVVIYAQGIGPVRDGRNRKLVAKTLNKVQLITVRDMESRAELQDMGVCREILVCVDPVLGLSADSVDAEKGVELLARAGAAREGRKLMVAARSWRYAERFYAEIAKSCDQLVQDGWQVIFLPFQYPEDVQAGQAIAALMRERADALEENYTPQETMAILKNADLVLGMRLHSLIMGAVLRKPLVGLSYDPKVSSFMQLLRQPDCFTVDSVDAEQLTGALRRQGEASAQSRQRLDGQVEIMARQAKAPAELLRSMQETWK